MKQKSEFTKGPNGLETDSKVVEAGLAALLVLAGYGFMKLLGNSKVNIKNIDLNGVKVSTENDLKE